MKRGRGIKYGSAEGGQSFGPGWTFFMPPGVDVARDRIIIRLHADRPSPVPDGWLGFWVAAPDDVTVESYQHRSREKVIAWARSTGVAQILVEDENTRQLEIVRAVGS